MNKSYITNLIALLLVLIGYFYPQPIVFSIGIFALSGAVTNVIAIHMLFEKVPFLYGSGVITLKFKEFKSSIRALILEQFFTKEKIESVIENRGDINLKPVIEKVDLNPAFDKLVTVIEGSQFGPMLSIVGGKEALEPMRVSFIEKMQDSIIEISEEEKFKTLVKDELLLSGGADKIYTTVEKAVEGRLAELTPLMVKDLIQNLIKTHLGWLVVWGGVFGGVFGLIASIMSQ